MTTSGVIKIISLTYLILWWAQLGPSPSLQTRGLSMWSFQQANQISFIVAQESKSEFQEAWAEAASLLVS